MPVTAGLAALHVHTASYFSEIASDPMECVVANWPDAQPLGDIESLELEAVGDIIDANLEALVVVAGGLPTLGENTNLHRRLAEVIKFVRGRAPSWAFIVESKVMEPADQVVMDGYFGTSPIQIDNRGFSPLSCPRWWWLGRHDAVSPDWPADALKKIGKHGVRHIKPAVPDSQ